LGENSSHAGRSYLLLGSLSGTSPPTELDAVRLPLADDDYLQLTLAHPNEWIEGSSGVLDAAGRARARLRIAPGSPGAGEFLWHAYVVLKPVPLTFYAGSNAVSLELTE